MGEGNFQIELYFEYRVFAFEFEKSEAIPSVFYENHLGSFWHSAQFSNEFHGFRRNVFQIAEICFRF